LFNTSRVIKSLSKINGNQDPRIMGGEGRKLENIGIGESQQQQVLPD
jgi:hypothetical protein